MSNEHDKAADEAGMRHAVPVPQHLLQVVDDDEPWRARMHEDRWRRAVPERFRVARTDDLEADDPCRAELEEWASGAPGPSTNLVLLGPVGVGKTHAGVGALRICHEHGRTVQFAPIVEALDALRPGGPPDAFGRMCAVGVLMLDDLGAERPTDWTAERLYGIVNARWLHKRPIIVTTNVPPADLEASLDPRLYSRLVHDATPVRFDGTDRRRS